MSENKERTAFEQALEKWTGRDMSYHHSAGTTGLDFAWFCWQQGTQRAAWQPIDTAPKDETVIDLWRPIYGGERLTDMRRYDNGKGNVFYEPVTSGYSCVRDATHWMMAPAAPNEGGKK